MKKIAVVAYSNGRTGSSATMGLLNLFGYLPSGKSGLIQPSANNPKGYFEIASHQNLLGNIYGESIYNLALPPNIQKVENIARKNFRLYKSYLDKEFYGIDSFSIKAPRYLPLPLLHYLKSQYKIKVIYLNRNLSDQVNSTLKVWSDIESRKDVSPDYIKEWILDWRLFGHQIQTQYSFDSIHISFEEIMENKINSSEVLCNFLGTDKINEHEIHQWLNDSLVNRKNNTWSPIQNIVKKLNHIFKFP